MKVGTNETVVVRRNPGYNSLLTKEWLVINAGACVGQFDNESEANTYRDEVVEQLPKREERQLTRTQELREALRITPKKEVKKRRQFKAELQLIKTAEAREKETKQEKRVKTVVEEMTEAKESPLSEAYKVLLPKKFHYHKGRRGRCKCETGDNR